MFQLSRSFFVLLLSTLLTVVAFGCAPTDENVFSYEQQLASGRPIIYNRYGEQNAGCRDSWTDVRLSPKEVEDLYFIGALATPGFGKNNCFTVGTEIAITVKEGDSQRTLDGTVTVDTVIVWNGNGPRAKEYKDHVEWEVVNNFQGAEKEKEVFSAYVINLFNSNVMSKQRESNDGVVHITHIRVSRPSVDAQNFKQKGYKNFQASMFEETTQDGETLSSCGTRVFEDYRTTKETWDLIASGKTQTAWDVHPGLLCAKQGAIISLVNHQADSDGNRETFGKIKIGKMRRMVLDQLSTKHIRPGSISAVDAMTEIEALYNEKAKDPKARLFLFDFELVTEGGEAQ